MVGDASFQLAILKSKAKDILLAGQSRKFTREQIELLANQLGTLSNDLEENCVRSEINSIAFQLQAFNSSSSDTRESSNALHHEVHDMRAQNECSDRTEGEDDEGGTGPERASVEDFSKKKLLENDRQINQGPETSIFRMKSETSDDSMKAPHIQVEESHTSKPSITGAMEGGGEIDDENVEPYSALEQENASENEDSDSEISDQIHGNFRNH